MALTPAQQAASHIDRARQILLVTKEHASVDALASVIAFAHILTKMGKSFDVLVPGIDVKTIPPFLKPPCEIRKEIGAMRAFHLTVNVKDIPLSELMYDVKDGKLDVTLVPKHGEWSPQDVAFKHGDDRYDLIVAVDVPDRQSLGALARDQADFIYRTAVINFDCNPANESWGQVNLVDVNAVSTTEVLRKWIAAAAPTVTVDEPLATALLTGMIAKSKSFRTPNVTPKTLSTASELIALGAKREEIVHGLWRNRDVATLKLWGRTLSRLEQDRDLGLIWATLAENDFVETGAAVEKLEGVVEELLGYAPEAKVVALITQREKALHVSLYAIPPFSAVELARPFQGSGSRERAHFIVQDGSNLVESSRQIIYRLRATLQNGKI